jgi:predicted nucleic acid-binding Zn ribbon protein
MTYYYSSKRPCSICGTEFKASRSDAQFCSANCRKVASRQKQALEKTYRRAAEALRSLEEYIKTDHRLRREALGMIERVALNSSAAVDQHKGQRHIYAGLEKRVTD